MLFTLLIKILRCSCPNCHHFKMNKNAVKRYEIQFRLILVLEQRKFLEEYDQLTQRLKHSEEYQAEYDVTLLRHSDG